MTRFWPLLLATLLACKTLPAGPPATTATPAAEVPAAAPAPAATAPVAPPKKIRTVEGITEYELGNGLQVLFFPDASKDTVTVNMTYFVGSRHEGYGETGMAHLLEHMLFKDSAEMKGVDEELEHRGGSNNGTTWTDRTNYFATLPAGAENLDFLLRVEADRMLKALLLPEVLASEFSVVRNEFEMGENDPQAILEERMLSTAYLWHNYGKSTIGSRADIEKVPVPALRRFYEKYYQPDNAMLVVAGKFDEKTALERVNAIYGPIPRPTRKLEPTYTIEPVQDGEREVTLRRSGDVAVVSVLYHVTGGADPDFAAVEAIADLLTDEPSGRLYKALVQTGLATSVSAYAYTFRDPSAFFVTATVKADRPIEPVRAKMIEIVEGLGKTRISEEEVARYRTKQKKGFRLLFSNTQRLAIELSESAALGDWRMLFLLRDHAAAVTTEQVQRVAGTFLKRSNRTLGTFVPTRPEAIDRAPLVETPSTDKIVGDYAGKAAISEGEVFEYSLENIEKRTTRGKLASGLSWAFLAKETRGDAVTARLSFRYGVEKDFKGRVEAAEILPELMRRGTRKKSFQQLEDAFDNLEAQVSFFGGPGAIHVNIVTTRDSLPEVLALVDEILREPAFPAAELEIIRKEEISEHEEQRQDPETQAFNAFFRRSHPRKPDDVLYLPTTDESIARLKAVKLADVKALHALVGASHAQVSIVGDFDTKAVGDLLEKRWGGWKSPRPWARLANPAVETPAAEEWIDTPDKEMAQVVLGYELALRDDDADLPALEIVNYVYGGSGFASRLVKRVREKEGWSYGAYSGVDADPIETRGIFYGGAIAAPQNIGKALVAAVEELQKLVDAGIPAEEVERAKRGFLKDYTRTLSSDVFVAAQLQEGLYVGRTLDFYARRNAAIAALTPEQVNAVAKKYLRPAALLKVTAGDKKKAQQ